MLFSRQKNEKELLQIFRSFFEDLSAITDLKPLLKNLLKALTGAAEVKAGTILLHEPEIKAFVVRESLGGEPLIAQFNVQDPFVNYLRQMARSVTKHEILADRHLLDIKEPGIHFFTGVNAEVVFPMLVENQFLGLLALGPRPDSKAYTKESLDLLGILLKLSTLSIHNALLFQAVSKQNHKLSEIATLKTQFVSTVTHELRTPLNGIIGLTDVLLDAGSSANFTDDQRRYIEMIRSAGDELLDLVNGILDLAEFQSKSANPTVKKLHLGEMIEAITRDAPDMAPEKRVQFNVDLGGVSSVYGDESQIRHLLQCLVGNAVKFSRDDATNLIRIQASRQGDMLKLGVLDRGIGIDEKDQEVIFEDFRQGDGAFTRVYGGTGIGLAIAKKIVEGHGGRIWVESKRGEGAQFFFTLPLKPGALAGMGEKDAETLEDMS